MGRYGLEPEIEDLVELVLDELVYALLGLALGAATRECHQRELDHRLRLQRGVRRWEGGA